MAGPQIPKDFRRVIVAASVGNVIEWYDFYIFGSLAAVLSVKFFEKSHPVAALLSTIALFTAGFLIRPLGAFLFGWMGDRIGRKYTFLVTLSGMGLGTGAIGLALSPSILFNSDGSLPVANSAIAAPTDAAMMRPPAAASRPRARGALGGSLREAYGAPRHPVRSQRAGS
jgi:MFS family permease